MHKPPSLSALSFASVLAMVPAAHGTTITVNTVADSSVADGTCTLREALQAANSNTAVNGDCVAGQPAPIVDVVAFAISGSGPHIIAPISMLGLIYDSLTIDGSTQPGAMPNTATPEQGGLNGSIAIEISGANCIGCNMPFSLYIGSGEVTLRGLAISHFIYPLSQGGDSTATFRVEGCHLGTGVAGLADTGAQSAISHTNGTWIIGGMAPAQRNLIVAHGNAISSYTTGPIIIQGNLIGTTRDGLSSVPSFNDAIHLRLSAGGSAQIGGSSPNARNVIASSKFFGIFLQGFSAAGTGIRVEGNYIGVGADGVTPLPNLAGGIHWYGNVPAGSGWPRIGGGNLIAWNAGPAVTVTGDANTAIEVAGNRTHDNGFGIDLDGNGRTPNDTDDADSGANLLLNHPDFRGYTWAAGQYTIHYRVDTATANAAYPLRVDFYLAAGVDDAEGVQWLGSDIINAADAQQARSFSVTGPPGYALAATSTDALGRSSEFTLPDRVFAHDFELL